MQRSLIRETILLAPALLLASLAPVLAQAGEPAPFDAWALFDRGRDYLAASYAHEPGLTVALGAAVVLTPLVALASLAIVRGRRAIERRRRRATEPLRQAMQAAAAAMLEPTPPLRGAPSVALEFVDGSAAALPIRGTMVRIGRHEENDIRLASKSVHRYHAVLHMTPDLTFVITDLSGAGGNGVLLNANRVEQATLSAGDVIELGDVKLRFAPAATESHRRRQRAGVRVVSNDRV